MPFSYETPPVVRDPYFNWLRTLLAGSVLGALSAAIYAGWNYAILTSRLESMPRIRTMTAAYPYLTLAHIAFDWMSAWLLTTPSPIYDPVRARGLFEKIDRLRSFLIRLILSVLFIVWSLRMWGLIGVSRLTVNPNSFLLPVTAGEVAALLLLWLHMRRLAKRAKLRGLAWRAVVVFIVTGGGRLVLDVGPLLAARLGWSWRLSFDQDNFRFGAYVLTGVMAMLAMGRFTWALIKATRTRPSPAATSHGAAGRIV